MKRQDVIYDEAVLREKKRVEELKHRKKSRMRKADKAKIKAYHI